MTHAPVSALSPDFQARFGEHEVRWHPRGPGMLLISFSDRPTDKGLPDRPDWAARFGETQGWSHLEITALAPSWYRDADLIGFFRGLEQGGFARGYGAVALVGVSMGGFAALSFAACFPGATVVAFSPQSTLDPALVPWDGRFPEARGRDWTLAGADAAETMARAGQVWLFYDPFDARDARHAARLGGPNVMALRGFGMQHGLAAHLGRMRLFEATCLAALRNELVPALFYEQIRSRKDYYFYRIGIETALTALGQEARMRRFRDAFRRRRQQKAAAGQEPVIAQAAPDAAFAAPLAARARTADWPTEPGNVWMLERTADGLRYLSDRWRGQVIGYEERGGITLAQTPPIAVGIVGFGHGVAVERPLPWRFPWHVTDETLDGTAPAFAALAEATLLSEHARAGQDTLHTLTAITCSRPGIVAAEALPGSAAYRALLDQVRAGVQALAGWGRPLLIDRVWLSLLAGCPALSEDAAAEHYATVAGALRDDLGRLTGQDSYPFMVVIQSAGSRTDGCSGVALAEGRADLDNPALDIIVACPAYPWPLMPGMPSTPTPEAALMMDELRCLAVAERQAGRDWYCPSLQCAEWDGTGITATFAALSGLHLDPGAGGHGFHIEGSENGARVTAAEVSGPKTVRLTCDRIPEGAALRLCYAWGQKADGREDRPANRGGLRDDWQQPSRILPEQTLYRHALSGRTRIVPARAG